MGRMEESIKKLVGSFEVGVDGTDGRLGVEFERVDGQSSRRSRLNEGERRWRH